MIFPVPTGWEATTLGAVIELQRGYDLPQKDRAAGNVPVVASTGIVGFHNKAATKGPGVVIGRSGSIGGGQFIAEDFWPLNTTLWVKDFRGNNPRFCYYLLKSIDFSSLNAGSGVPTLNRNHLHPLPVLCPSLAEQHAIAEILGTLDDRITNLRQSNATLEAMAQALFKSWFVDFEDVPQEDMQESELGLIPKGWRVVPASEIIVFNPKEPLRKNTIAPYLDMASLSTTRSWTEPPTPKAFGSGMRFRNGDALLARITPCLENGKSAFVQNLPDETIGWGSTEFIVMRSKKPVPQEYAYLLARHNSFREYSIRSMTGTSGRQRAQADIVAQYKVAIPPDNAVWSIFSGQVDALFKRIKSLSETTRTLAALRDILLPKLISGAVRIPS